MCDYLNDRVNNNIYYIGSTDKSCFSFSFRYIPEPVIDITNIVVPKYILRYMQHHNNYD